MVGQASVDFNYTLPQLSLKINYKVVKSHLKINIKLHWPINKSLLIITVKSLLLLCVNVYTML